MRERKKFLLILLILVILLAAGYFLIKSSSEKDISKNQKEVCIKDKKCFSVESVSTAEKMALGLGSRDSLEEGKGMLFIFPQEETPGFWMKDMKFPIDLIWIDENKKIDGIEKNMQPCDKNSCPVFYPNEETMYVLEINSGLAENYDFEKGDFVYFRTILVYFFI